MIWASQYWKEELFRHARLLRKLQTLKRWGDRSNASLEKSLMIGFYSIRKLVEAHTVSDEIRDRCLRLQGYPWKGKSVTFLNWDRIDEKYDLENPAEVTRSVKWIANQMVHSFAFMPCFDVERRLDSVLFNSDRTRHLHLYVIHVDKIIGLFEEIGANDPASMECRLNQATATVLNVKGPTHRFLATEFDVSVWHSAW